MVFPGDEIAVAEEFVPGPGTYEENGRVLAARIGVPVLDSKEFVARVDALTNVPVVLRAGDEVLGVVNAVRSSMAIVEVHARCDAPEREIAGDTNGTLHISRVSDEYVPDMESTFKLGDILRAEVVGVDPSLQLATKAPQHGVLRSLCPRCRAKMDAREGALVCPECEWKDTGKISTLYGTGKV